MRSRRPSSRPLGRKIRLRAISSASMLEGVEVVVTFIADLSVISLETPAEHDARVRGSSAEPPPGAPDRAALRYTLGRAAVVAARGPKNRRSCCRHRFPGHWDEIPTVREPPH